MISKNNQIRKIKKALILIYLVICTAQAEDPQKQKDFSHNFTLGLEGFHYQYSEATDRHKHFMHFKGLMGGINANYQLTYKDKIFLRPEMRVVYGKVKYGSFGQVKGEFYQVPSLISEQRLLIGIPFKFTEKLTISPYTGSGHRYKWDNGSKEKTKEGFIGRKRRNYAWYIPVGVRFQYDLNEKWNFQAMGEYNFLLSATQISGAKKDKSLSHNFNQTQGKGLKGEFLVGRKFDYFTLSTGVYGHYWKIRNSNTRYYQFVRSDGGRVSGYTFEPKNVTTEIGFKLTIGF